MAYPNTDWPTSVDAARVVVDQDTIYPGDFNFQDGQIRAIQGWLGVDGDLIGEGGTSTQGPGGLASPIADGGTAVTLAAKADYTSGKLLSIGDNYDAAYSEKASVDFEGKAVFAGVQLGATTAVTSILDEDTMSSDSATALATQQSIKAYVDTEIAAAVAVEDLWDRAGTVLSPSTSGDTIAIGVGAVGAPGLAFEGALTTGFYLDSSEILTSIAGVKTAGIEVGSNIPYMNLYRDDTHGTSIVGAFTFLGKDAVGTEAEYAQVMGYADSAAGGSEVGSLIFKTATSASGALTEIARVTETGVEVNLNGTATAAAISRTGDPNTGIYFPSADYVALATGGASWYFASFAFYCLSAGAGGPRIFGNGAGSESTPTYCFVDYTDTGCFVNTSPTQERLSASVGGKKVAEFDATTPGSTAGILRVGRWDNHGDSGGDVGVGNVTFMGTDSVGSGYANEVEFGDIRVACTDDATGAENGKMELKIMDAGSSTTKVSINPGYVQADPGSMHTRQVVTSTSNQVAVDCKNGFVVYHLLTENTEIQPPSNETEPAELIFLIDGDGSSTITFKTGVTAGGFWKESAWPALGSDDRMTVKFIYDSANDWWVESGRAVVEMASGS
jgi:hypothetical protein